MVSCLAIRYLVLELLYNVIYVIFLHVARLEYEQKRDVDIQSRITKLESTLVNLRSALKGVEKREIELKASMEKSGVEIDHLKEEVLGK